jgi:hypothetical protein
MNKTFARDLLPDDLALWPGSQYVYTVICAPPIEHELAGIVRSCILLMRSGMTFWQYAPADSWYELVLRP